MVVELLCDFFRITSSFSTSWYSRRVRMFVELRWIPMPEISSKKCSRSDFSTSIGA